MKRVVYDDREAMLRWATDRMPFGGQFRPDAQAIGLAKGDELVAVAVFDTFAPRQCNISIAAVPGRRWITRDFMRHVAGYAFGTCGFNRLACVISENNGPSRRFAVGLGFRIEGRQREAGAEGEDWLLYGLLRRECRWAPPPALLRT